MNWNASKLEYRFASRIAAKAMGLLDHHQSPTKIDHTQLEMDLIACHLNGCPLDFEALANADDGDLIHDVLGIRRHIDRATGKLGGCFVPRFAESEQQSASDAE